MKNPRFEKEDDIGGWRIPKKENVKCKNCYLRAEDRKAGNATIDGATLGTCQAYKIKPPSIILGGSDCPYFIDEKDE